MRIDALMKIRSTDNSHLFLIQLLCANAALEDEDFVDMWLDINLGQLLCIGYPFFSLHHKLVYGFMY